MLIDFEKEFISIHCHLVNQNKLEELVAELSASLSNVKHEQEFMEVRERIHRASK